MDAMEILMGILFSIFSTLLGVVLTNAVENIRTNKTSVEKIKEIIIVKEVVYQKSQSSKNTNNENDNMYLILIAIIAGATWYVKYNGIILYTFTMISILMFVGILLFGTVLYLRNSLDDFSRYWIIVTVLVIVFNCFSIVLMENQDLTMFKGIEDYARISYYLLGITIMTFVNVIIMMVYAYIVSISLYIKFPNKITYKIVSNLNGLFSNHKKATVYIAVASVLSLGFSSGIVYELIMKLLNM